MKQFITNSDEETRSFAEKFAKSFKGILALSGELGAGKTTFVQGFAKGLGIKDKIISPTFVLMRHHKIPKTKRTLHHIDLYRIEDPSSILNIGLEEIISNPQNIVVVEWAEKAKSILPENITEIIIENTGKSSRKITVKDSLS